MKTLAISILNWNGFHDTILCINSILDNDFKDYDIYVIDNGSKNDEGKKLEEYYAKIQNIKIIFNKENLGFTGGNNLFFEKIVDKNYQYLALLNNDIIIDPYFLKGFLKEIKSIKNGYLFGPVMKNYYPPYDVQSAGGKINTWLGIAKYILKPPKLNARVDYLSGACLFFKKELLDKIGILDNNYFAYREEADFCYKAKKRGLYSYVIKDFYVKHKHETGKRKIKPYYTYLMFRNRILFLKKYANSVQYVFSYFVLLGYLVVIFPLHFKLRNYNFAFRGIKDGIQGKFYKEIFK